MGKYNRKSCVTVGVQVKPYAVLRSDRQSLTFSTSRASNSHHIWSLYTEKYCCVLYQTGYLVLSDFLWGWAGLDSIEFNFFASNIMWKIKLTWVDLKRARVPSNSQHTWGLYTSLEVNQFSLRVCIHGYLFSRTWSTWLEPHVHRLRFRGW